MKAIATQLAFLSLFALANSEPVYGVATKREFDRDFMHFGKRADAFDRSFMNFGKRESEFSRDFLNFGKRTSNVRFPEQMYDDLRQKKDFDRDFMHFGKRSDSFERNFMNFGKRDDAFSRDFLSFGKWYPLSKFATIITNTLKTD